MGRNFHQFSFAGSSFGSARKLASNPTIDAGFQHVEWQASSTENFIVEGPEIETGAKLLFRAIAKIENLELADLIAEDLCRPCNVPVNFSLNGRLVSGAAFAEVGDGLFAGPTFGVNAGVDHQANSAHQFQIESSVI